MNHYEYHTDIENAFIRCRGKKIMLNPSDWKLMTKWKDEGIPLHIVVRGIESTFKGHDRSISSLGFCVDAIEAEYKSYKNSHVGESIRVAPVQCTNCFDTKEVTRKKADAEFDWQLEFVACPECG